MNHNNRYVSAVSFHSKCKSVEIKLRLYDVFRDGSSTSLLWRTLYGAKDVGLVGIIKLLARKTVLTIETLITKQT